MARRQYSSCRTVRRTGTLAPALSQPSGQEFFRLDRGLVVFWRLAMGHAPQLGESGHCAFHPPGSGRAATEPHQRGRRPTIVAVRTWVSGQRSRSTRDVDMRGVHPRTEGSWRRSTGTRSRDVGSQVRNDQRLRRPPFLMASAALMTPVGGPSTGSALSGIPRRVKPSRFRLSPLELPQSARP